MSGANWGDHGYGGFDDDVTLGDPFLAGVKRTVGRLAAVGAILTVLAVGILTLWVITLLAGSGGTVAPHNVAPAITGGIGNALMTVAPDNAENGGLDKGNKRC
jgi:hypothetical protein